MTKERKEKENIKKKKKISPLRKKGCISISTSKNKFSTMTLTLEKFVTSASSFASLPFAQTQPPPPNSSTYPFQKKRKSETAFH